MNIPSWEKDPRRSHWEAKRRQKKEMRKLTLEVSLNVTYTKLLPLPVLKLHRCTKLDV